MALVSYLAHGGPDAVHNIDNLMLRESMDVIGMLCNLLHQRFSLMLRLMYMNNFCRAMFMQKHCRSKLSSVRTGRKGNTCKT